MIVGLGYRARSGKDTTANYLVREYGFKRIGFADSLKEACRHIFGFTDEQLFGKLKEVIDPYWGFTPRYAMQKVGTECMRDNFDKEIWIKSVEKKILDGENWVITDVRFPNEALAVQRWNGFLTRIDRDVAGATGGIEAHPSEIALDGFSEWNYILRNPNQSFDKLYSAIDEMMASFRA